MIYAAFIIHLFVTLAQIAVKSNHNLKCVTIFYYYGVGMCCCLGFKSVCNKFKKRFILLIDIVSLIDSVLILYISVFCLFISTSVYVLLFMHVIAFAAFVGE